VDDGPDSSVCEWLVAVSVFPASGLSEHVAMRSETAQVTDQLQREHVQRQRIESLLFAVKNLEGPSFKVNILYRESSDLASPESNLHRQSNEQKITF
jgi:hypothetical protein